MKIFKLAISLFLLLTYALGSAHGLIPHCQEMILGDSSASHHHHEHHQHTPEDNIDHEHIVHKDHLDGGVFDFILCFLSDIEHPANHCSIEHFAPKKTIKNFKTFSKDKLIDTFFAINNSNELSDIPNRNFIESTLSFLSPPLNNSPHRGPPTTLSC